MQMALDFIVKYHKTLENPKYSQIGIKLHILRCSICRTGSKWIYLKPACSCNNSSICMWRCLTNNRRGSLCNCCCWADALILPELTGSDFPSVFHWQYLVREPRPGRTPIFLGLHIPLESFPCRETKSELHTQSDTELTATAVGANSSPLLVTPAQLDTGTYFTVNANTEPECQWQVIHSIISCISTLASVLSLHPPCC